MNHYNRILQPAAKPAYRAFPFFVVSFIVIGICILAAVGFYAILYHLFVWIWG